MKHQRGITLIEWGILLVIAAIIILLVVPSFLVKKAEVVIDQIPNMETRQKQPSGRLISEHCISGYKFLLDLKGQPTQILDDQGRGIRCD